MEKIFPFDIIPRIVSATEWSRLEKGLKQRIHALNLFIDDLYHDQKILKAGVVPREIILIGEVVSPAAASAGIRRAASGATSRARTWCGTATGRFYVLEDNLRCPSGVSYVLQNRQVMKSLFPKVFAASKVRPVDNYPLKLRDMLEFLAPDGVAAPHVVLLTPGIYNSAYFEHSFLAQQMGVELVEGRRPGGGGRPGAACAPPRVSSGWT